MNKMAYVSIFIIFFLTMCNRNSNQNGVENNLLITSTETNHDISFDYNVIEQNQLYAEIIETETNELEVIDFDISSVDLLGFNRANLFVGYTEGNNFIGYINLNDINPDIEIGDVYIYDKYIVLEEYFQSGNSWFIGGFNVYEYNPDIKITEYRSLGNRIYSCIGEPYWFKGIHNDYIFIDIGTGPGIRGIEIYDFLKKEVMLSAAYNNRFYFQNNKVGGLVISESSISYYDEDIKTIFFNYKENVKIPEETFGLFPVLLINYTYNVITKEIEIISGEYILEQ